MTDTFNCTNKADNPVCELPMLDLQQPTLSVNTCPVCGEKGKPVQLRTVKAMVSVSLREVQGISYLFCRNTDCPVVYFSSNSEKSFTVEQIRETVYQKQPDSDDVFVCYCFQHTVGEIRKSQAQATTIVDDINRKIQAGQCACDLRNPQGTCCLGNVNELIKQIMKSDLPIVRKSL